SGTGCRVPSSSGWRSAPRETRSTPSGSSKPSSRRAPISPPPSSGGCRRRSPSASPTGCASSTSPRWDCSSCWPSSGAGSSSAVRLGEAAPHFVRSAEPGDTEAVVVLRDAVRQAEGREAFQESLTILAALVELLPAGDPRWAEVVEALSWDAQWVVDHRADAY